MQVKGIHHATVVVDDLATALAFYTEVLGLTALPRPDFGIPGAWLDAGNGDQVHLIELAGHPPASPAQHFAFEVDDLDAIAAELATKGVEVKISGRRLEGAGYQGTVQDPAGNTIELNQPVV